MFPSSLANTTTTARRLQEFNKSRRKGRAIHRAMSGMGRHPNQWWRYVFVTLTSAPDSPDIQRSWRRLHERMRRRGLAGRYIRVVEAAPRNGMIHIHLIVESVWLDRAWLAEQWSAIHGAQRVWVTRCYSTGRRGWAMGVASEVAGYFAKDSINRMSYSKYWAFPALAGHWKIWRKACRVAAVSYPEMIRGWNFCSRWAIPPTDNPSAMQVLWHNSNALDILWRESPGGVDTCLSTTDRASMHTSSARRARSRSLASPKCQMPML